MRVLLIGASGRVGCPVLRELRRRGHDVTAFGREPAALLDEFADVEIVAGDAFDVEAVGSAIAGHDVLVTSVALRDDAQSGRSPLDLTRALARAASGAGTRWVSLGGAGSLRTAGGEDLVDAPDFPALALAESRGFRDALHALRAEAPADLEWTVVSPAAVIVFDGPRTGSYRSAGDDLLLDEQGRSTISVADLAVAVVDEVESGAHRRARFAVAY